MRLPTPRSAAQASVRMISLGLAIAVGFAVQGVRSENQPLTARQISEQLIGRTIRVETATEQSYAYLALNGVMQVTGPDWSASGPWIIFNDEVCFYVLGERVQHETCAAITPTAPDRFVTAIGTSLTLISE